MTISRFSNFEILTKPGSGQTEAVKPCQHSESDRETSLYPTLKRPRNAGMPPPHATIERAILRPRCEEIIHPGSAASGTGLRMRGYLSKLRKKDSRIIIEAFSWQVKATYLTLDPRSVHSQSATDLLRGRLPPASVLCHVCWRDTIFQRPKGF